MVGPLVRLLHLTYRPTTSALVLKTLLVQVMHDHWHGVSEYGTAPFVAAASESERHTIKPDLSSARLELPDQHTKSILPSARDIASHTRCPLATRGSFQAGSTVSSYKFGFQTGLITAMSYREYSSSRSE